MQCRNCQLRYMCRIHVTICSSWLDDWILRGSLCSSYATSSTWCTHGKYEYHECQLSPIPVHSFPHLSYDPFIARHVSLSRSPLSIKFSISNLPCCTHLIAANLPMVLASAVAPSPLFAIRSDKGESLDAATTQEEKMAAYMSCFVLLNTLLNWSIGSYVVCTSLSFFRSFTFFR